MGNGCCVPSLRMAWQGTWPKDHGVAMGDHGWDEKGLGLRSWIWEARSIH